MLANYHTHTRRCKHAVGEDRQYVEAAIEAGYSILGFSDHCPWIYPYDFVSKNRMLPDQLSEYVASINDLKKEYSARIEILVGLECEYIPELADSEKRLMQGCELDYLILGQHTLGMEPIARYNGVPNDDEQGLALYVDTCITAFETGRYAYIAHPDLYNFAGADDVYEKHMTRLCEYLRSKDSPVELNILGLLGDRHYPSERFLKIAQKVGNSAIIGVDAHDPQRLLRLDAREMCEQIAARYRLRLVDTPPPLQK